MHALLLCCRLIDKLAPGQAKYKVSKIPFMQVKQKRNRIPGSWYMCVCDTNIIIVQMENIACFLSGAERLGVPKYDLFQTVDLYEKKNMTQVNQSSNTGF